MLTRYITINFKTQIKAIRVLFSAAIVLVLVSISSCAARRTHFMQQIELERLKDGTYIAQDRVIPICSVKLSVTIKDGKITEIKILKYFITFPLAGRAYTQIPKRIIKEQSLDVDAVTAATVSTNNIKKAVLKALEKATKGGGEQDG
ncbi:MAG: FMN-binding protein [Omnitrophica bacterium]|nr:FMN-binding protein [Candidatus Omnitrophota bacterium]